MSINVTQDGKLKKELLKEGDGPSPTRGKPVTVHYTGTLLDGTVFDSSKNRNQPFQFTLGVGQVIKGWDLGVATMKKGEQARFTIDSDYAYGRNGIPGVIPQSATLVFEVELLAV